MGQVSSKLRRVTDGFAYWCQGCEEMHHVNKGWEFDGNLEAPTFSPSVLVTSGHYTPGWKGPSCWCTYNAEHPNDTSFKCECCHTFIKGGMVQFLGDCTHALAGQTLPLPELPLQYRDDYKPEDILMTQTDEDRQASDAADTAAPKEVVHAHDAKPDEKDLRTTQEKGASASSGTVEVVTEKQPEDANGGNEQAAAPVDDDKAAHLEQTLGELHAAIERFDGAVEYLHSLERRIQPIEDFVEALKSSTSADFSFPQLVEEFKSLKLKLRHTI